MTKPFPQMSCSEGIPPYMAIHNTGDWIVSYDKRLGRRWNATIDSKQTGPAETLTEENWINVACRHRDKPTLLRVEILRANSSPYIA